MRISDWSSDVCSSDLESRFQTIVTQSSAQANTHSPGGAINQPFFANNTQGSIQQVSSTTSIAVVGGGFIPVSKKNGENADRKSVVKGKSGSVRVDLGGRRAIKKKKQKRLKRKI